MNKLIYILTTILILSNQCIAEPETENLNTILKTSGYEPNYFSVVLSLVFVVFLIYVTGILYTKLNKVGVNTIKKEFQESSDIKPIVLSTTPIGHDKTLQVIEIAGEKLLIGVSQHSVSLIKTLGKELKYENNAYKTNISEPTTQEAMNILYKQTDVEDKTKEEHTINEEDFGLYKKYLR